MGMRLALQNDLTLYAFTCSSFPARLMPCSMAVNQGMPPILTTTATSGSAARA